VFSFSTIKVNIVHHPSQVSGHPPSHFTWPDRSWKGIP
jgi:hypothetical protein